MIIIIIIILWYFRTVEVRDDEKIIETVLNREIYNKPTAPSMDDKIVVKHKKLVAPLARTTGIPLARRMLAEELDEKDILTWWD